MKKLVHAIHVISALEHNHICCTFCLYFIGSYESTEKLVRPKISSREKETNVGFLTLFVFSSIFCVSFFSDFYFLDYFSAVISMWFNANSQLVTFTLSSKTHQTLSKSINQHGNRKQRNRQNVSAMSTFKDVQHVSIRFPVDRSMVIKCETRKKTTHTWAPSNNNDKKAKVEFFFFFFDHFTTQKNQFEWHSKL